MIISISSAAVLSFSTATLNEDAGAVDPAARAVVERTWRTTATYSLYNWNWVRTSDGAPHQEWAAEFHRGSLHRVETPTVRVIADCAAGTGTAHDPNSGETFRGPQIAASACGINANRPITSLELAGSTDTRFGPADTVRMFDDHDERIYVVDRDGVLVAAEYFSTDPGNRQCLQSAPVALERSVPDGDIFSEASLSRSIVDERYKAPPSGMYGDFWIGDRRCIEEP